MFYGKFVSINENNLLLKLQLTIVNEEFILFSSSCIIKRRSQKRNIAAWPPNFATTLTDFLIWILERFSAMLQYFCIQPGRGKERKVNCAVSQCWIRNNVIAFKADSLRKKCFDIIFTSKFSKFDFLNQNQPYREWFLPTTLFSF